MTSTILKRLEHAEVLRLPRAPVDAETLQQAQHIVDEVRSRGEAGLRRWSEALGDVGPDDPLVYSPPALRAALTRVGESTRALLERGAARVRAFAEAQRAALNDLRLPLPGGVAGHRVTPVEIAGCYAPGGRFPLPSTVLMTAVTARAAGVREVWVASPRPSDATLAAAAVAGADGLLCVGGAQAIAALAFGVGGVPRCDVIVGPGNRWVTAAKKLVAGEVGIDMLAGPTELVVLADELADPRLIAADLLAQAEHDVEATPILLSTSASLVQAVDRELGAQLDGLATAETARAALQGGFAVVVETLDEAIALSDRLAPEHLEVMTRDAPGVAARCRHFGALFVGGGSAEVLGDYCAGPNHTLPTGGSARFGGGLSALDFLRVQTWLQIDDPVAAAPLYADAEAFGEIEGLAGHAAAARRRGVGSTTTITRGR